MPTTAEQGYPGIEMDVWHGIVAPAGTPAPIVQRLNEEFVKAALAPDIVQMIAAQACRDVHQHAGGFRQADRC